MRSYTSAKREYQRKPVTFDLDGRTFSCEGGVTTLDVSEFARYESVEMDDPRAVGVLAEFFENTLGAKEYARFRTHVREHGTSDETIMEIMQGIIEDVLGRPTERPSDSSDGPSTTGTTLKEGSSPQVIDAPRKVVNLSTREVRVIEDVGDLASSG